MDKKISREVSRSIRQTPLGGKCNEENTTEQWDQRWLSEMLNKVLEATIEEGRLSWDLNNKKLTMWRSEGKKQKGSVQRPRRWKVLVGVNNGRYNTGRVGRVGGNKDGEVDRNHITWDWISLAKKLRIILFHYNGKPSKCFERGKNVNWFRETC